MQSIRVLRENRFYIGLAGGLFLLGWLVGWAFSDAMMAFVEPMLDQLKDLAEKTQAEGSALYTSTMIFLNNLRAAFVMFAVGLPLAVFTIFSLFFNGLVVGVVFDQMSGHTSASHFEMLLYGLMPHGIFELPALFIMGAFGIKLGLIWIRPLEGLTRRASFIKIGREVLHASWIVVLLLVVAALIEGHLTPLLLDAFVVPL